jgi:hypothetical protein
MEELVDAVLAGVDAAKAKGLRRYIYVLPGGSCGCNITLEGLVEKRLPDHVVNHMTITHPIRGVEKRLVIDW